MPRISDLLREGRTFSFEFFPPKNEEERQRLEQTLVDLQPLAPSFASVTYRGGASSRRLTTQVVLNLLHTTEITPMPHLTCVAHPRRELIEITRGFVEAGLENLLALGGDSLPDSDGNRELRFANELVALARASGTPSIGVAAHPAQHPHSPDRASDRRYLAAKLEAADFAITQFFFHVGEYLQLVEELGALGIHKPVIPGIMPITNLGSLKRMAELSGYAVPPDVVAQLERVGDNHQEVRQIGIEMASELCRCLLEAGAPGLHFYTLNRSTATREIYDALGLRGRLHDEANA